MREAVFTTGDTTLNENVQLRKDAENYSFVIFRVILSGSGDSRDFAVAWIVKKSGPPVHQELAVVGQ